MRLPGRRVSSNSFGKLFTVTTFGESHGPAIGCVVDGCPPGLALSRGRIPHGSRSPRDRAKAATPRSGTKPTMSKSCPACSKARTTGTPIALLIRNTDARSKDYNDLVDTFRPGHADYTYLQKYGIRDHRGGGRSSARETTMRVAAARHRQEMARRKIRRARARPCRADRRSRAARVRLGRGRDQSVLLAGRGDGAGARELHHGAAQVRRFGRRARHRRRRRRAARLGRADLRQARRRSRRRR